MPRNRAIRVPSAIFILFLFLKYEINDPDKYCPETTIKGKEVNMRMRTGNQCIYW